jgi:hypothetical protein
VGSRIAAVGVSALTCAFGVSAEAQPQGAHPTPPRASRAADTPILVHRDPASDAIAVGRSRMAKSDWGGALEAFDAALRTSVDVTVHRDRGICHEQLGHPFPAMDDYRIYLTALPEAADADDIRNRLNALEVANGQGGSGGAAGAASANASETGAATTSTANHEDPFAGDTSPISNDPGAGKAAGVSGGGGKARESSFEQEEAANDKFDQAESSPLRRGKGLSFGAYGRGFAGLGSASGVTGYGAGATVRGAVGSVSTFYGEIGYASYQSSSSDTTFSTNNVSGGGLAIGLGYEARIRLDQYASNALILAVTVSYERLSATFSGDVASQSIDLLAPRGKFGYRHVFGPGFGVEIAAEAGQPVKLESSLFPSAPFIGGSLALLVGF